MLFLPKQPFIAVVFAFFVGAVLKELSVSYVEREIAKNSSIPVLCKLCRAKNDGRSVCFAENMKNIGRVYIYISFALLTRCLLNYI